MALRRDAKVELIKRVPLFADCTKGELRRIASIADELTLRHGTVLTREGRVGHEFFVLIDGSVRVSKDGRRLADLGGGDWLGEIEPEVTVIVGSVDVTGAALIVAPIVVAVPAVAAVKSAV